MVEIGIQYLNLIVLVAIPLIGWYTKGTRDDIKQKADKTDLQNYVTKDEHMEVVKSLVEAKAETKRLMATLVDHITSDKRAYDKIEKLSDDISELKESNGVIITTLQFMKKSK